MRNIIIVGKSLLSVVKVTRFVCENCGYSEEWIEREEDIQKLAKKYGNRF